MAEEVSCPSDLALRLPDCVGRLATRSFRALQSRQRCCENRHVVRARVRRWGWRSWGTGLVCLGVAVVVVSAGQARSAVTSNGMLAYAHRSFGATEGWWLETVNADGTGRARLQSGELPRWAPAGNDLLLSRSAFVGQTGSGMSSLFRIRADGSGEQLLSAGVAAVRSPSWSPDGSQIAYKDASRTNSAAGEIWVMKADGTGKTRITNDGLAKGNLDWGGPPSGPRIAYVGFAPDGGWGLFTIAPDGTARARVTAVPSSLAFAMGGTGTLDWSSDGTRIALASTNSRTVCGHGICPGPWDIWVVDLRSNSLRNVTGTSLWGSLDEKEPSWSPDGTRIAFSGSARRWDGRRVVQSPSSIYVMSAGGGGATRVTAPGSEGGEQAYDILPSWQPCVSGVTRSCVSAPRAAPAPAWSTTTSPVGATASRPPEPTGIGQPAGEKVCEPTGTLDKTVSARFVYGNRAQTLTTSIVNAKTYALDCPHGRVYGVSGAAWRVASSLTAAQVGLAANVWLDVDESRGQPSTVKRPSVLFRGQELLPDSAPQLLSSGVVRYGYEPLDLGCSANAKSRLVTWPIWYGGEMNLGNALVTGVAVRLSGVLKSSTGAVIARVDALAQT